MIQDVERRGVEESLYQLQPAIVVFNDTSATTAPPDWTGQLNLDTTKIVTNTANLDITVTNRNIVVPEGYNFVEFQGGCGIMGYNGNVSSTFGYVFLSPVINGTQNAAFNGITFSSEAKEATHYVSTSPLAVNVLPEYQLGLFVGNGSSVQIRIINSWAMFKFYKI